MTFTRTQARLLQQTIEAITSTPGAGFRGTEMISASSESNSAGSILDGPIVLYGAIFYKPFGGATVNLEFKDGSGGAQRLDMGNMASNDYVSWYFPPGVRFTDTVHRVNATSAVIRHTLLYVNG